MGINIFPSMCLLGFIWAEIKQMWDGGFQDYIHDWWNLMDFVMNSLYLATISLKIVAYTKVDSFCNLCVLNFNYSFLLNDVLLFTYSTVEVNRGTSGKCGILL